MSQGIFTHEEISAPAILLN